MLNPGNPDRQCLLNGDWFVCDSKFRFRLSINERNSALLSNYRVRVVSPEKLNMFKATTSGEKLKMFKATTSGSLERILYT